MVNKVDATLDEITKLRAENAKLKAEAERLAKSKNGRLSLKVSSKGGVSLYGVGRFPVSLYRSQWERVLGAADEIKAFIEANRADLAEKSDVAKVEEKATA